MKKQLTVALGLVVLATPAFASKARLLALGEDANGSFFINDNRNIFLNAAEANNHSDMVTFELGDNDGTDSDVNANAEGGILYSHKNLVYGVHLGGQTSFDSVVSPLSVDAATLANGLFKSNNVLDLFIAGDAGFKWGANLTYSSANNDTFGTTVNTQKAESDSMDLNVGVVFGNLSLYADAGITGEMKLNAGTAGATPATKIENDGVYEVGGSYKLNNYTIFAQANMSEYKGKVGTTASDLESKSYTLGAARSERLSDKTMMFVKLSASQAETTGFDLTGKLTPKFTIDTMRAPVAIGFEHDATSWLSLRGSVVQDLWSNQESKASGAKAQDRTIANSTRVNAGATLKLGDFMVDGLVGTNDGAGNVAARENQKGVLALDNLMTRVSMTYRF